jgi:hypothetical protein
MKIMKKLLFIATILFSLQANAQSTKGFDKFWAKFQPLLIAKKYTALAAHVQFPLKGLGVLDDIKPKTYTKVNYGKALTAFLNLDDANHNDNNATDDNGDYITMKKSDVLAAYATYELIPGKWKSVSGNTARVDDLEFKYIGGKWKFTSFYDGRTE